MIKAIIFDCFGVIRPARLLLAYRHFGGNPERDAQFIKDTMMAADRGMIPTSHAVFAERLDISVEDWGTVLDHAVKNDQELLDFIRDLRTQYKTGLLSNISKGRLTDVLGSELLEAYFDVAVASGDIGYAKPEPEAYEIVAEKLGVRLDECVFTDDQPAYCEGARAVGMQAIMYQNFSQFKQDLETLSRHDDRDINT